MRAALFVLPLGLLACSEVLGLSDFEDSADGAGAQGTGATGTGNGGTTGGGGGSVGGGGSGAGGATGGGGAGGCEPGTIVPCYSGPAGTADVGQCLSGTALCTADGEPGEECLGEVLPGTEDCTTVGDEDCNGFSCSEGVWAHLFGDADEQLGTDVAVDVADGSVYAVGSYRSGLSVGGTNLIATLRDAFVIKLGSSGAPVWAKSFGAASSQGIVSASVDSQGNLVVLGSNASNGVLDFGDGDIGPGMFVAKLDPNGDTLWTFVCDVGTGGPGSLAIDPNDDSIVLTASFNNTTNCTGGALATAGFQDILLLKLSAAGAVVWGNRYGSTSSDQAHAVAVGASGHIAMTGQYHNNIVFGSSSLTSPSNTNAFIVRLTASGDVAWSKNVGTSTGFESGSAIAVRPDGGVLAAGDYNEAVSITGGPTLSGGQAYLFAMTAGGAHAWSKNLDSTVIAYVSDLASDAAGDVHIAGSFYGMFSLGGPTFDSGVGDKGGFVGKLAGATGDAVWSKWYGKLSTNDFLDRVRLSLGSAGEVHLVGTTDDTLQVTGAPITALGLDVFVAQIAP